MNRREAVVREEKPRFEILLSFFTIFMAPFLFDYTRIHETHVHTITLVKYYICYLADKIFMCTKVEKKHDIPSLPPFPYVTEKLESFPCSIITVIIIEQLGIEILLLLTIAQDWFFIIVCYFSF